MRDIIIDTKKLIAKIQKGACDVWVNGNDNRYALPLSRIIEEALSVPLDVSWGEDNNPLYIMMKIIAEKFPEKYKEIIKDDFIPPIMEGRGK